METKDDMDSAKKRLRASRQKAREEAWAFGLKHGKNWAMQTAEWPELCAVTNIDFEGGNCIYELIDLLKNFNHDDDKVEGLFGRDADNNSLRITNEEVEGFIEGARLVHRAVEDYVDEGSGLAIRL